MSLLNNLNFVNIFVVLFIVVLAAVIFSYRFFPYNLVRFIVWILAHTLYKIKIINKHNLPLKGGALIVANHISFIDAILIVVTVPRPIRFIISREIYNLRIFHNYVKINKHDNF